MGEIIFYGDVDKGAFLPGWTQRRHMAKLQDSIQRRRGMLERGSIPPEQRGIIEAAIKKDEKRFATVQRTRPQLRGGDKDRIAKAREELGEKISEAMFTRDEAMKGLADPYEEFDRSANPCIKVDPELAAACNVKTVKGEASRKGAEKMFKIFSAALDEKTNTEILRKDKRA